MNGLRWWARWWARYFPRLARARLRCRHDNRYDTDGFCLTCGAPWFFYPREKNR